jgi:hypothetical protein
VAIKLTAMSRNRRRTWARVRNYQRKRLGANPFGRPRIVTWLHQRIVDSTGGLEASRFSFLGEKELRGEESRMVGGEVEVRER